MTLRSLPVLSIKVDPRRDGRDIALALTDVPPGRHVRLVVGDTLPPLWLDTLLAGCPAIVQVEATTERALAAWDAALRGDACDAS